MGMETTQMPLQLFLFPHIFWRPKINITFHFFWKYVRMYVIVRNVQSFFISISFGAIHWFQFHDEHQREWYIYVEHVFVQFILKFTRDACFRVSRAQFFFFICRFDSSGWQNGKPFMQKIFAPSFFTPFFNCPYSILIFCAFRAFLLYISITLSMLLFRQNHVRILLIPLMQICMQIRIFGSRQR